MGCIFVIGFFRGVNHIVIVMLWMENDQKLEIPVGSWVLGHVLTGDSYWGSQQAHQAAGMWDWSSVAGVWLPAL